MLILKKVVIKPFSVFSMSFFLYLQRRGTHSMYLESNILALRRNVTQFVLLDKFYMFLLLCQQLIRSSFGVLTMRKGRGPVVSYFFLFFCVLFSFLFLFLCLFFCFCLRLLFQKWMWSKTSRQTSKQLKWGFKELNKFVIMWGLSFVLIYKKYLFSSNNWDCVFKQNFLKSFCHFTTFWANIMIKYFTSI